MFLTLTPDLPAIPSPIVSSLYKSRCEDMAVIGPGPQWLGEAIGTYAAGIRVIPTSHVPFLSRQRVSAPTPVAAEYFQLHTDSPVVLGVSEALFQGSHPLTGTEYSVLSELVDELALAQTSSRIPGMR